MDNTMVSARVPQAKKERANGVLSSIGATTSDLINSAIDYVIEHKELPGAIESAKPNADDFKRFVNATTLDVDWPQGELSDYKSFMRRERLADYESLA